jgi:thiamine biosynthesis lipoprotein
VLRATMAPRFGGATWTALGTGVHLVTTDAAGLPAARAVLERELSDIDQAASRFRPDSEVTYLTSGATTVVSPLLAEALGAALRAARLTDGAVDPTVGATMVDLGYDRDFAQLTTGERPGGVVVRQLPGWRSVELDPATRTVRVPPATVIDLGATAKAFTADRAAARAADAAGCGVLVSLGGDVAVAGQAPPDGWRVTIADHHASTAGGPQIVIRSGGLATSSITARRWQRGGQTLHHLLDPTTCRPATGPWRTVSVAARTCLDANTASTAAIVLGDRGQHWLAATGLAARMVAHDGTVSRINGWPEETR